MQRRSRRASRSALLFGAARQWRGVWWAASVAAPGWLEAAAASGWDSSLVLDAAALASIRRGGPHPVGRGRGRVGASLFPSRASVARPSVWSVRRSSSSSDRCRESSVMESSSESSEATAVDSVVVTVVVSCGAKAPGGLLG